MSDSKCRKPCKECPFSKTIEPGRTGNSSPTILIGQAYGPFFLPCHMDPAYTRDRRSTDLLQCAGAAVFRANVGVAEKMPEALLQLPASHDAFETPEELIAHHAKVTVEVANMFLSEFPPERLLRYELEKQDVQVLKVRGVAS